jgi:hypothetical protein
MSVKHDQKASVTIRFDTPAAALDWFEKIQAAGYMKSSAVLAQQDGLDRISGITRVPGGNEFIAVEAADHPNGILSWASQITDRVRVD